MNATVEERFWAKVNVRESGACWPWQASTDGYGYGAFYDGTRVTKAHRYAFMLAHGYDAVLVDHVCHNTRCVNPAHLRESDKKRNAENVLGARRDSRTGVRGVCRPAACSGKYLAQVGHNGQHIRVGLFDTIAEADAAATRVRLALFTCNDADLSHAKALTDMERARASGS